MEVSLSGWTALSLLTEQNKSHLDDSFIREMTTGPRISQGSPEKQKQWACIHLSVQLSIYLSVYLSIIYDEGLAPTIMKAERPRDLLSASWRPRKASAVTPVPDHRPEDQGSQWCKCQSESGGTRQVSQLMWSCRERVHPLSALLLNSGPRWIIRIPSTLGRATHFPQFTDSRVGDSEACS